MKYLYAQDLLRLEKEVNTLIASKEWVPFGPLVQGGNVWVQAMRLVNKSVCQCYGE